MSGDWKLSGPALSKSVVELGEGYTYRVRLKATKAFTGAMQDLLELAGYDEGEILTVEDILVNAKTIQRLRELDAKAEDATLDYLDAALYPVNETVIGAGARLEALRDSGDLSNEDLQALIEVVHVEMEAAASDPSARPPRTGTARSTSGPGTSAGPSGRSRRSRSTSSAE